MKKLTNLLTILMMFAGLFIGGAGVFGATADHPNPSTTRQPEGDLTIHKYIQKAGQAQIDSPADGSAITKQETLDELAKLETPTGIDFYLWKVGALVSYNGTDADATNKFGETYKTIPGGANAAYSRTGNELTVTIPKASPATGVDTFVYTITATTPAKATTNAGLAKWTDLAKGEYYVEEDPSVYNTGVDAWNTANPNNQISKVVAAIKPFVVAVPMTIPNSTGVTQWNNDVHVYPKNSSLEPQKDVTPEVTYDKDNNPITSIVTVGSVLEYSIKAVVPEGIEDYKKFLMYDNLDKGLDFVDGSIQIFEAEYEGATDTYTKKDPNNPMTNAAWKAEYVAAKHQVLVDFSADFDVAKTPKSKGLTALKGKRAVIITFKAKINDKAQSTNVYDKNGYVIKNIANIVTNDNPGSDDSKDIDTPTDPTETPVGEAEVVKIDQNNAPLVGAEFGISDSEANAKAEKFIIRGTNADGETEVIYPADKRYNDHVEQVNGKWVIKGSSTYKFYIEKTALTGATPTDYAAARFYGLNVKINVWAKEVSAPTGYNLYDGAVNILGDDAKDTHAETKVTNTKGFTLPSTGGPGLIALTVAGIVIVGLGIMVAMPKKRKDA